MLEFYVMGDDFPNFKSCADKLWRNGLLKEEHIHYLRDASFFKYKEENPIKQWMSVFKQTLDKIAESSTVCITIINII